MKIVRQPDEIIVKDVLLTARSAWDYLARRKGIIAASALACAIVFLAYAWWKKPVYTAECTFVLQERGARSNGLGQYSALASLAGIDVGAGNDLFEGDNIFELYRSRLMLKKTLLTPVTIAGKRELLIDRLLGSDNLKLDFHIAEASFTTKHDSVIKAIVRDFNRNTLVIERKDKKLGLISVRLQSEDALFAKAFTETLVDNVNSFYIRTRMEGNFQNVSLLQLRTDSIRRVLSSSMGAVASSLDAVPNANPNRQVLRVPSERKSLDVQASTAIYFEVLKNLEIARATMQREMPLIRVIDEPLLPLDSDKPGKASSLILGAFAGALLAVTALTAKYFFKTLLA